jgi:hypothetical protein
MFLKISEDKVINTDHLTHAIESDVSINGRTKSVTDLYFTGGGMMRIGISLKDFADFMYRMQSIAIKGT